MPECYFKTLPGLGDAVVDLSRILSEVSARGDGDAISFIEQCFRLLIDDARANCGPATWTSEAE